MHSLSSCLMHCVFATKERQPFLSHEIRDRLHPYLGGIARDNSMKALAIGGTEDHVHILLSIPATLSVSKAMQLMKGNFSKWLRDTFPEIKSKEFAWQQGFGAFSISVSSIDDTVRYIRNQEQHHQKKSFRNEFENFLRKHKIEFDPKHIE
ncbi:MAG: IS200/IS605 family transposase [Luteolibacter sp.]